MSHINGLFNRLKNILISQRTLQNDDDAEKSVKELEALTKQFKLIDDLESSWVKIEKEEQSNSPSKSRNQKNQK